jgi:hypothetical protein
MEIQVAKERTPVAASDVYAALSQAWSSVVGGTPSRSSLLVLLAQTAFETGQWASMWNYNLGNIKHVTGDGNTYIELTCTEYDSSGNPYSSPCYFRAYNDLTSGAAAFIQFLSKSSRYSSAWAAVLDGDPHTFVQQLKADGYFTGSEASYESQVVSYFTKFNGQLPSTVPNGMQTPTGPSIWITLLGGLALGGAAYLAYETYALKPSPVRRRRVA